MMFDHETKTKLCNDAILAYAAGNLSPARRAIMACQRDISEEVNREIAFHESIASGFMLEHENVPLSPDFFDNINARISELEPSDNKPASKAEDTDTPLSRILKRLCGCSLSDIKWKMIVPGLGVNAINGDRRTKKTGECLYLLRGKSGVKIPEHSHRGEEWVLVLQGAYESGGVRYSAGDIHMSDESDEHSLQVVGAEECICLIMTEGPLKMKRVFLRLMQPLAGI